MALSKEFSLHRISEYFSKKANKISIDIKIAISVFAVGMVVGIHFISTSPIIPQFYQREFSPALMSVCGKGYVQPNFNQVPKLVDFLSKTTDILAIRTATFSCSGLPVNLQTSNPTKFAKAHRYLMGTVALFWSVLGISWSALTPLYGIFYGATVAISYGLFRLGMGRILAAVGSLLLIASKIHLENLPHLRDYSKAPFILALVLITGYIVKLSPKLSTLLSLSAVCGTVLGIGLGFRMDLLIYIPVFLAVLFFFLPSRVLLGTRIKATIVFFVCFFITAFPIIISLSSGGNTFHVILLGFMSPFNQKLNVVGSLLYEWGYLYNDTFLFTQVSSYAHRIHQSESQIQLATREYDQACFQYFLEIVTNFPADMLTRVYAAVIKILKLPFETPRLTLLTIFQNKALFITTFMSLILSIYSFRVAIFILLFLIYLSGYPAFQFDIRHYFHLEFISLWILGFILQQVIQMLAAIFRDSTQRFILPYYSWKISLVRRPLCFALGTLIFLLCPLYALRWYQHNHLGNLFNSYLSADMEELQVNPILINNSNKENENNSKVFIEVPHLLAREEANLALETQYLAIEFSEKKCEQKNIPITFRYEANNPFRDFSRNMEISAPEKGSETTTKIFFPVYSGRFTFFLPSGYLLAKFNFKGIELSEAHTSCLVSIHRFKNINRYPLLLNLALPSDWKQVPRYQTIKIKS